MAEPPLPLPSFSAESDECRRNRNIVLLSRLTGRPVRVVEELWRAARRHARADGAARSDYTAAYEYLARQLRLKTTLKFPGCDLVSVGAQLAVVQDRTTRENITVYSCMLII